jgi:hypothetical protein
MGQNMVSSTHYEPNYDTLRTVSTKIVLAAGVESEGILPSRAAHAAAALLGTKVGVFPSGHSGFLGGEYGQTGEPDAFAARLREALQEA